MTQQQQPDPAETTAMQFPVGTFTPKPQPASFGTMLRAQAKIESLLFLRHGEQQLLSLIIPVGILLGLSLISAVPLDDPLERAFPMTLAVAIMGAGFTGQAIAVAFDRRYGALKRIGASGVPTPALIGGKIIAVGVVVAIQLILLSIVALLLGWTPTVTGFAIGLVSAILGVGAFTALGLLLGGALSSEMVLALSNTLWFIMMGAAGYVAVASDLSEPIRTALTLIPSVALTEGFLAGFAGSFPWFPNVVLLGWTILASLAARKFFSFTIQDD